MMMIDGYQLLTRQIRNKQNPYDFLAQAAEGVIRDYRGGRINSDELTKRFLEHQSQFNELNHLLREQGWGL